MQNLSNLEMEPNFVLESLIRNNRLDGRCNADFRNVKIIYGKELGSVVVTMGETKVLAQIATKLVKPKPGRPMEGGLYIHVDLEMGCPHFEADWKYQYTSLINRTLERTFVESQCIDLDSLCVKPGVCVWALRIVLNVLNHMGNLIDCCSIAALAVLAQFKRPDVTISATGDMHIFTSAERHPIPIVLNHFPICVSFYIFYGNAIAIADPTIHEERNAECGMVVVANSGGSLGCLRLGNPGVQNTSWMSQFAKMAAMRAKIVVDILTVAVLEDQADRAPGVPNEVADRKRFKLIACWPEDGLFRFLQPFIFGIRLPRLSHYGTYENIVAAEAPKPNCDVQWEPTPQYANNYNTLMQPNAIEEPVNPYAPQQNGGNKHGFDKFFKSLF